MFETAKKYSEQVYYNKADLEKEMDFYLVDPLWHEITQYRSLFRHEFPIKEKKTYLIRNCLNGCCCIKRTLIRNLTCFG